MQLEVHVPLEDLRKTLCVAQNRINSPIFLDHDKKQGHLRNLRLLVDEIDRHRPLDETGEHKQHTKTCGCKDEHQLEMITLGEN